MKFRESVEKDTIDIHIIEPGWGSSGYYSEQVLSKACDTKVYPAGTHMHIDHPTRSSERENPARTILGESPIAAIFVEDAHYEADGWDGPGPYASAKILPEFREKLQLLGGHIGISHYVNGKSESGTAPDGRKGKIIKELLAGPLNTVDFVTVPGAGGSYKTMFAEAKQVGTTKHNLNEGNMPETKLTLAEIRAKHPGILDEYKAELHKESAIEGQAKMVEDLNAKVKTLEAANVDLKKKVAEAAAEEFVAKEVAKAKLPEASSKIVVESLKSRVIVSEDGTIDAIAFEKIVKEAIEAKTAEVDAIRKESSNGITGNGQNNQKPEDHGALLEAFKESYLSMGYDMETSKSMAELSSAGRR